MTQIHTELCPSPPKKKKKLKHFDAENDEKSKPLKVMLQGTTRYNFPCNKLTLKQK